MIHRRAFCKAIAAAPVLATPGLLRSAFADEVSSIVLISQTGLPYLPMMVMEHFKLIEKHAEKLGVASLKPEFKSMGGTPNEVRALSAVQSMPFMLVTNRETIKTIKDFNEHDKIAVPSVKNVEPGDLSANGGRQGVGPGSICQARSVHDHAPASGCRHVGDVEGDRGQQPLFGGAFLLLRAGDGRGA